MKEVTKLYKRFLFNFKKKINIDEKLLDDKSLDELFNYFGTDKGTKVLNPYLHDSNEILGHGFAKFYEKKLLNLKNDIFNILEIGTWEGASTAALASFFPNSKIYGIDKNFRFRFKSERIFFNYCNINDTKDLKKFTTSHSVKKFKIVIDDASHILTDMIRSLKFFFKYLEGGGYFILEDFNAPVYFESLNDSNGEEILMNDILENLKRKKYFKSSILSKQDQQYLFDNILNIEKYKGKTKISDIAFIQKN